MNIKSKVKEPAPSLPRGQRSKVAIATALIGLGIPAMAIAQAMTSANYKIPFDDLSGGGIRSTSTNYIVEDTIAEAATPSGEDMTSTNYKACAGFQCLQAQEFLTVNIATSTAACTATTTGSPPFTIALGTVPIDAVTTASTRICVRASSNASGGVVATVRGAGLGLTSQSDSTAVIDSVNTTLAAGAEGYGICSTNAQNGFTAQSPFNGSCGTSSGHAVGGPTTSAQTIYSSSGAVTDAFGDILIKASAAPITPNKSDYADTLTFIVTATF